MEMITKAWYQAEPGQEVRVDDLVGNLVETLESCQPDVYSQVCGDLVKIYRWEHSLGTLDDKKWMGSELQLKHILGR